MGKTDDRGKIADCGLRIVDLKKQKIKTEGGTQRSEIRGQKAEDRGQRTEDRG